MVMSRSRDNRLFWALRGGGGNFGVVTRFDYRLHRHGPAVLGGTIVWPLAEGREVLEHYREFSSTLPMRRRRSRVS